MNYDQGNATRQQKETRKQGCMQHMLEANRDKHLGQYWIYKGTTYIFTHTHTQIYIYIYIYIYICMHECMYVYAVMKANTWNRGSIRQDVENTHYYMINKLLFEYTHTYTYMCVYIYICIHTYSYTGRRINRNQTRKPKN